MDSFFSKGFKAAKCKTLLKLTLPRIKLLRNRREMQLKQMRKDIAMLLETGQEATARIRIEHIIREEKMMAAQEIIELFCELIAVRLPIIEVQKECPLDLKEAISSVCFAAPRCPDLPELQQVQILFLGKYGKDFLSAATELRPECGVNRQLIELLSIRAPTPDVKLKLLKEIAEEHALDWDPGVSESELLKPHEDLLNGPTQFVNGSNATIPNEKHEVSSYLAPDLPSNEVSDSEAEIDSLNFPEVPKQPIRSSTGTAVSPEMLPFPASALSDDDFESDPSKLDDDSHLKTDTPLPEAVVNSVPKSGNLQFVPPQSTSVAPSDRSNSATLRTNNDVNIDFQDVLAAAIAAAESAEQAAYAARSTASLAQIRITELSQRQNEGVSDPPPTTTTTTENSFHVEKETRTSELLEKSQLGHEIPLSDSNRSEDARVYDVPSYDDADLAYKSCVSSSHVHDHQFQRLPSMDDDDPYSYPSLFTSHGSNVGYQAGANTENSKPKSEQ